jgi:hypothetical protein
LILKIVSAFDSLIQDLQMHRQADAQIPGLLLGDLEFSLEPAGGDHLGQHRADADALAQPHGLGEFHQDAPHAGPHLEQLGLPQSDRDIGSAPMRRPAQLLLKSFINWLHSDPARLK